MEAPATTTKKEFNKFTSSDLSLDYFNPRWLLLTSGARYADSTKRLNVRKNKHPYVAPVYSSSSEFVRIRIKTAAGSGSALRKRLDPDPQIMNADPQPCPNTNSIISWYRKLLSKSFKRSNIRARRLVIFLTFREGFSAVNKFLKRKILYFKFESRIRVCKIPMSWFQYTVQRGKFDRLFDEK